MPIIGAPTDFERLIAEDFRKSHAGQTREQLEVEYRDSGRLIQSINERAEELIESFKTCDAKALYVMTQTWKKSPAIIILPHVLLQTFLFNVDETKVPKSAVPPVDNDPSERAWASFIGLEEGFVAEFPDNPDFRSRIIQAWPGIFKWCGYFYSQRVSQAKDANSAEETLITICTLLYGFLQDDGLGAVIRATDGFLVLYTQLWMHPSSPPSSSLTLTSLLRTCSWEDLDEVLVASSDNPDLLAKIAVDRLRTAMNRTPMVPDHVSVYAHAIFVLSRLAYHPLTPAILEANATWVVVRMLSLVADVVGSSMTPEGGYLECLNMGFTFIRFALIREDSQRWVVQAVDAGLLRVISELCPLLERKMHQFCKDCIRHIVRETLPQHLVYLSVITVVSRELNETDSPVAEARMRKSWLWDDWLTLIYVDSLRSSFANLPKALRGAVNVPCGSEACTTFGKKHEFKRCTGCLVSYYCSKECQKESWSKHRALCKLQKASNAKLEDTGRTFSPTDHRFFRELFMHEAKAHLPHLKRLARRKYPNEPGDSFLVSLDFTNTSYPTGTCALKLVREYVFPPQNSNFPDPPEVLAHNAEMIGMVRANPSQYTFIEAKWTYGEERVTRHFTVRGNLWDDIDESVDTTLNAQIKRCENQEGPELPLGLVARFLGANGSGA